MAQEKQEVKLSAPIAFCHAHPREDGSIDPHQPYMGVISITMFHGKKLENIEIKANVHIELRVVQPGINYPVRVLRLRNGSLKRFISGKELFTAFNTRGQDLEYTDYFGSGFNEFFNIKVINGLYDKLMSKPIVGSADKYYRVMFTVDTNGNTHRLNYQRFEEELTDNAATLSHVANKEETTPQSIEISAGEELLNEVGE